MKHVRNSYLFSLFHILIHRKADELKRSNPSGLVPTLIPIDKDGEPNEEKVSSLGLFIS